MDRELVRFSMGETFDANVKMWGAAFPRCQSTGRSDTYFVHRVWQCPPFAMPRKGRPIVLHFGLSGGDNG